MATTTPTQRTQQNSWAVSANRALYTFSRNWFIVVMCLLGLWVGLPWLAPVFMHVGWETPAKAIYSLYSLQCHQLPQRSFFLFGRSITYPLEEIQTVWRDTTNPLLLRQFIGNAELGYKVAWSDRMVSAYTSIPLAGLFWWVLRKRLRPLPLWGFALLGLPMAMDGGTHLISDLSGIGQGFRYTNQWLASLTSNSLPPSFYVGGALGSFNSWMRLITGIFFGIGLAWFSFPYLNVGFIEAAQSIHEKFNRAGMDL